MSGWGFSLESMKSKLGEVPSLEEMKKKMNTSVEGVGKQMAAAKEKMGTAAKNLEEAAKNVKDSKDLMNKVKGVFDLDALNENAGQKFGTQMTFPKYDVSYVTKRIIVMGYPSGERFGGDCKHVASFLNQRHGSDYVVWNISEKEYDYGPYQGQVMDFKFPGYPAPPLGMLFKLCMSMESWLNSDEKNVVIIHCMTGKGRSAVVASCLLEWIGKTEKAKDALRFVCERRRATLKNGVVPTQIRYVDMFHDIMEGIRPRYEPLNLKKMTVFGIPDLFSEQDKKRSEIPTKGGCRPYLQVFKNGKLLFTTAWADKQREEGTQIFQAGEDDSFSLDVDCFMDGDILLRVRHVDTTSGKGVSMFRYGFHTGYIPIGILTLSKRELDSASVDNRFPITFKVELEFEPGKIRDEENKASMFDSKTNFWDEVDKKREIAKGKSSAEKSEMVTAPKPKEGALDEFDFSIFGDEEIEKQVVNDQLLKQEKKEQEDLHKQLDALTHMDEPVIVDPPTPLSTPTLVENKANEKEVTILDSQKESEENVEHQNEDLFDELEALEKELGLENSEDTQTKPPSPPPQKTSSQSNDDETTENENDKKNEHDDDDDPDLAELENYLSGL